MFSPEWNRRRRAGDRGGATAAVFAGGGAVEAAVAAVEVREVVEAHGEGGGGHGVVAGDDALPGAFEAHAAEKFREGAAGEPGELPREGRLAHPGQPQHGAQGVRLGVLLEDVADDPLDAGLVAQTLVQAELRARKQAGSVGRSRGQFPEDVEKQTEPGQGRATGQRRELLADPHGHGGGEEKAAGGARPERSERGEFRQRAQRMIERPVELHGATGRAAQPVPAVGKMGAEQHQFRPGEGRDIVADHAHALSALDESQLHLAVQVPAFPGTLHGFRPPGAIEVLDFREIVAPAQQAEGFAGVLGDAFDLEGHGGVGFWPRGFAPATESSGVVRRECQSLRPDT